MTEKKICPINPHGDGYCKQERCALWVKYNDPPVCAFLNISNMIENMRFHVRQIDMQGIGVYNQDDGL